MKKSVLLIIITLIVVGAVFYFRHPLERILFEKLLNLTTHEFFGGSLRLKSAAMDRNTRIHIRDVVGTLQSEGACLPDRQGPVTLEMTSLETERLVPDLFSGQGSVLHFSGIRPAGSQNPGIQGRAELRAGSEWSYKAMLDIEGLDLGEIQWLNPENLKGSAGFFKGTLEISADSKQPEPQFQAVFLAGNGGTLQARFFEVLLPYLPALPTKQRMEQLAASRKLVPFRNAAVRVETAESNRLKVALHIEIPDYNVELNINLEIRIEEQTSFSELARVLGLVRVNR